MWPKKSVELANLERINSGYVPPNPNVLTVSVRVGKRRETHGVAATRSHFLMREKNNDHSVFTEPMSPVFSPTSTSSTVFSNSQGLSASDS